MALRVFLTHNPEDLEAYYGRALADLQALDVEVVTNPLDRDLETSELAEASRREVRTGSRVGSLGAIVEG